jgi:hypothetical protein
MSENYEETCFKINQIHQNCCTGTLERDVEIQLLGENTLNKNAAIMEREMKNHICLSTFSVFQLFSTAMNWRNFNPYRVTRTQQNCGSAEADSCSVELYELLNSLYL